MFDYNAPQFANFEGSDHDEFYDSFFDTLHLSQEAEAKRTPRSKVFGGQSTSEKKHSMITRQDSLSAAKNNELQLRSRSVGREPKLLSEGLSRKKKAAPSALKNHAIHSLTVPVTPLLLTKTRSRPTAVLPYADQVLLQVEEFNKLKDFPLPLNKKVLENPPTIVLPHAYTVPKPFNITQIEVKEKPIVKPEVFVFKAQPIPNSIYNKPCNIVKPFTTKEKYLLQKRKKKLENDAENKDPCLFRAKRAKVLEASPFLPVKSNKPPTMPKDIVLQTAVRAEVRASFRAARSERLQQRQMFHQEAKDNLDKELMLYRKSLVHKPLPVPPAVRKISRKRKPDQ